MAEKGRKVVSVNRKARHEYFIEETYDAGIALAGTEVKSIRAGKLSLQDAFARVDDGEVWVHGMFIAPYEFGSRFNLESKRPRKLLLKKNEIERLRAVTEQKGLTIIPLQLYFERGFAKIELGVARGKKLYDKRDAIAERDAQREAQRELSER